MGWIVSLLCIAVLVVLARKTLDRETTRNMKFLGKMLAAVAALIVLMVFLSYAGH
jgi:quinol-cytochrome oxidoreductase complex cytochrome b subunit